MKREYYMKWREDFDDQQGWFTKKELETEIKRINELILDEENGEASIEVIIKGEEVTSKFDIAEYKE